VENPPTAGDHISIPGWLSSASLRGSTGFGLYRHHMLVTAPATVECDGGKACYRVQVIHLNGKDIVEEEKVLRCGQFRIHSYPSKFMGCDAVHKARKIKERKLKCGQGIYHLLFYNCESFIREAKTGEPYSRQVKRSVDATSGTVTGTVCFVPTGAVIGGIIGTAIPVAGTAVGVVAGGFVAGVIGVAVGFLKPIADYAHERITENNSMDMNIPQE